MLSEVPISELAALLADAAEVFGGDDRDRLFREALSRLGMHRLTTEARRILARAFAVDRTASENATVLKFEQSSFEEGSE